MINAVKGNDTPKDYDNEWDTVLAEENGSTDDKNDGTTGNADPEVKVEPEIKAATPPTPPATDWEKEAKNQQAGFTRSQQENAALKAEMAEIKARMDELSKPKEKDEDPATEEEKAELAKLEADYGEIKPLIAKIIKESVSPAISEDDRQTMAEIRAERAARIKSNQEQQHLVNFVIPSVARIHPDFYDILQDPNDEFRKWAAKNPNAETRRKALDSSDPIDIMETVSEFKSTRRVPPARRNTNDSMMSSIPGASRSAGTTAKLDDNAAYDSLWDEELRSSSR